MHQQSYAEMLASSAMSNSVKTLDPSTYAGQLIAVISDIHANAVYLAEVLKHLQENPPALIIVLGDLWTYGCHPDEVMELLTKLSKTQKCIFVRGNHDQFYFNYQMGKESVDYPAPQFVRESVDWTIKNSRYSNKLLDSFEWVNDVVMGRVFLSHANPFGGDDWTYLNSVEECRRAARVLEQRHFRIGIFGHTHRRRAQVFLGTSDVRPCEGAFSLMKDSGTLLLNPGSVGQPRGEGASYLLFRFHTEKMDFSFVNLEHNAQKHCDAIANSGMTQSTRDKLISYFGEINSQDTNR